MAKLAGKKMLLVVDGVTLGATRSFTLTINNQVIDVTTKDSDAWGESLPGFKDWEISFDGLYDPSNPMNAEEIYDAIENDSISFVEAAVIDGDGGGLVFSGNATPSGLNIGASYNDAVTMSGGYKGSGKISKGTVATS